MWFVPPFFVWDDGTTTIAATKRTLARSQKTALGWLVWLVLTIDSLCLES